MAVGEKRLVEECTPQRHLRLGGRLARELHYYGQRGEEGALGGGELGREGLREPIWYTGRAECHDCERPDDNMR